MKPPVRASNAALAALMPNATARFVPLQGHGWIGAEPDLHLRMVDAWLAGQELHPELLAETTPWNSSNLDGLLDSESRGWGKVDRSAPHEHESGGGPGR